MSEYKNYLLRQLGLPKSSIKENGGFPKGFDDIELDQDDINQQNPSTQPQPMISPTAMSPVIAVAVRGSKTGGLPSGDDGSIAFNQGAPNMDGVDVSRMTKGQLGGYEPVSLERDNSKIVNKTPVNPDIDSPNIIAKNPQTTLNPHPHQVQLDRGEPPQAVTGASTDGDATLKVGMNDMEEEEPEEVNVDVNETFSRHLKLMKECITERNLDECDGDPNCKCGCDDKEEKEPKKVEEKYSAPFSKMRGLANLGERRLGKDGIWENNHVGADDPFVTHWKMDKEKSGMVKVDEKSKEKWMQDVRKGEEEHGTKGALHKDLGISQKKTIPTDRLKSIQSRLHKKSEEGNLSAKELKLSRRVNAALNMRESKS